MKLVHTIDLVGNGSGIISLSLNHEPHTLLAYPSTVNTGEIILYDIDKSRIINAIQAHKTSISCLVLNNDSSLLGCCSEKGTVIRIYRLPDCTRLYQFRRGNIPTTIFSIAFSPNSRFFSVSSDSTVHIFKLEYSSSELGGLRKSITSYLPGIISEAFEPFRDFARIKLSSPVLNISSFNSESSQVYIVTRDGFFFQYLLDVDSGGECELSHQFRTETQ